MGGEDEQRKQMVGSERDHEPERRPGEEEEPKKASPGEAKAGAGAGTEAGSCDYCGGAAAAVYCRADAARLCLPCDRHVHGANGVCSRHARAPLCADCHTAGAVFRRASPAAGGLFLCSNCDFGRHRDGGEPPFHDRCAVQAYTGCPPAHDLAALLGVPLFDKPAVKNGGWWNIWEEPQVLSLEDLIVPTTPCHGFQPLLMPFSPKNRSISPDGKMNQEILQQLGELAETDGGAQAAGGPEEAGQAGDQFPSWAPPPQNITEHGSFGTENNHEVATMPTPGYENGRWNSSDYHALNDVCKVELTYDQAPDSSAEACLSSFVPMSKICPGMINGSSMEDNHQANPGLGTPMKAFPKRTGFDVVPCPERDSVISRYKEKRKTRRFDKQVRYESRKVRADGRLRVKGRFAKANQN